jgi:ribosomal protein S18 acetylase RimI-like enzyme
MMGQQAEVRASAQLRRIVADPYALSPDRAAEPGLGDERDPGWARHDGGLGMWTGPFAMAGINTRVVRRSNALQGWAYGRRFRYREVTGFGAGPAAPLLAGAASAALKAAEAGLAFGPSRAMLARLLPAPGQGPGERTRRTGYFRIEIHTRTSAGARYVGAVEAQGDPGYAATSVMLGETALCLALDRDQLPDCAGVLTPATAMGAALTARLRSAGHTLTTRQTTQLPGSSGRLPHTGGMIRLGTSADLAAASGVYRRASLSNAGDRDNLLAHREYLVLGPEGLAEGRTHVAEQDGSVVGFATWAETAGTIELEDLFVDPGYMRRGIATALVSRIAEVLRARETERLEVTANPHAMAFYRSAGFIDCGVAETNFGAAPRLVLVLS